MLVEQPQETLPESEREVTQSATSAELRDWLSDLPTHGPALLDAVQKGSVRVTTTENFDRLVGAAKAAQSNEKLALKTREYAEEYARDRAAIAAKNAELTEQVVACRNAMFYFLKAFDGVAAKSDLIMDTMRILGIGDDGKMPAMPMLMMKMMTDGSRLMGNAQQIMGGFDGTWLRRIDVEALKSLMEGTELDLQGYDRLTDLMHTLYPQPTIQIPATTNG